MPSATRTRALGYIRVSSYLGRDRGDALTEDLQLEKIRHSDFLGAAPDPPPVGQAGASTARRGTLPTPLKLLPVLAAASLEEHRPLRRTHARPARPQGCGSQRRKLLFS